jgi:hypothetical protein
MLRVTGLMTIGMFGRPESDRPNPDFVVRAHCARSRFHSFIDF